MSEYQKHQRVATTNAQRQTRFDEITSVAKEHLDREAKEREAKTRRLRALRFEREKSVTGIR